MGSARRCNARRPGRRRGRRSPQQRPPPLLERRLAGRHGKAGTLPGGGDALEIARRDGWGLCDADKAKLAKKLGRTPTRGDIVAEAVDRDYEHMRRWCADLWQYVGVIVTHEESGESASLWGVESEDDDYLERTAHELADDIGSRLDSELAATIAESRPDLAPNYP